MYKVDAEIRYAFRLVNRTSVPSEAALGSSLASQLSGPESCLKSHYQLI